jgi:hypothetical protein
VRTSLTVFSGGHAYRGPVNDGRGPVTPARPSRLGYIGTAAIVLVAAMLGIGAVGSWLEGASLCRDDDHMFGVVLSVLLALLPIVAGAIVARRTLRWGLHPSVRAVSAVVAVISLPLILYYAGSTAIFGPRSARFDLER